MLRRLGIRGKVLAALAVPVIVLFGAASVISAQAMESSSVARAVNELVSTADELAALTNALQVEREATLAFLADLAAPRDALAAARSETDTKSAEYAAAIASVDVSVLDGAVGEYLQLSRTAREKLPTMSARLDTEGTSLPTVVDAEYTALIKLHVETARVVADVLPDRSLAKYIAAYGLVGEAREKLVQELPAAVEVVATGGADARAVVNLAPSVAVTTASRAQARTAVNQLRLTNLQLTSQDAAYAGQRLLLSSGNAAAVATMDLASFEQYSAAEIEELSSVAERVRVLSVEQAVDNQAAAVSQARITIAATLLIVLVSIAIALLIAGQIVVPLRRLTTAVGDVRRALPLIVEQVSAPGEAPQLSLVQIPVTSRDEVGRLARAFNDVNATTIRIAEEQAALRGSIAEMFVNVARRDQVLLNRQISFIDALEQTEEDPNVLGDLFRLDHLATRMRRNAESLLVLAGIESGRRMRDAMPLSDVIRTASSEIEQYDRVQLELGIDPSMVGFSALAAAHLLAELLENATVFSEPGTPVEVATSTDVDYVQVIVRDHGLGMSDAEIEAAQLKIRSTSAGDVLGAQRLGFYVVGRLAARLKAQVVISNVKNGKGTLVEVRFPARLFELAPTPAADQSTPSVLVEPEPPVVEAVDLAALTDGETSLGLPRRRIRADAPASAMGTLADGTLADGAVPADALPATAGGLEVPGLAVDRSTPVEESVPERDGRMFVLPPLEEARLTPELEVRTAGWAPEVPAAVTGSRLPNRANAQRKAGVDPTVAKPVVPRVSKSDRGTLFGGFRGRTADVPASADRPPLDLRTIPGAHDVSETDVAFVLPELVIDDDDAFVIPQLEPDEIPWAPQMELAETELVGRADVPEVVPTMAAPIAAPAPVSVPPVAAPPVAAPPVSVVPVAAPPVAVSPGFVSTLNEARAWGAEDLSASSWRPAPAVGEVAAVVELEPVVEKPVPAVPVLTVPVLTVPVLTVPDVAVPVGPPPTVGPDPTGRSEAQFVPAAQATRDLPDESAPEPFDDGIETSSAQPEPQPKPEPQPEPVAGPPAPPAKRSWFRRRTASPVSVAPPVDAESAMRDGAAEPLPVEPFVPMPFVPEHADRADLTAVADASAVADEPAVTGLVVPVEASQPEPETSLPSRGKPGRHGRRGAETPELAVSAIAAVAAQPEEPQPEAPQADVPQLEVPQLDEAQSEAVVTELAAPDLVAPDLVASGLVTPAVVAPPRSMRGFFGQRTAGQDARVVVPEPTTVVVPVPVPVPAAVEPEPAPLPEPEPVAVTEPEPTVVVPAQDPTPLTPPWAPTSVAEIIGSALDPTPVPQVPVAGPRKPAPRASRRWWGRKSNELLEDAPWFASATELPAADSIQAIPTTDAVPWVSTSGEAPAAQGEVQTPVSDVVETAPVEDLPPAVAVVPVAIERVTLEPVALAPVATAPLALAPVAVVRVTAARDAAALPAVAPLAAIAPAAGPLPTPEVTDATKPTRRGRRNWLGQKAPAGPEAAGQPQPTALPMRPPTGAPTADPAANNGRWTPSGPAPRWTPQRDLPEFEVYTPSTAAPAVPSGGWAVPSWADQVPADGTPKADADNAGVPTPALPPVIPPTSPRGQLDDDVAAMLALRSDIQEQAFAELGQLAAYRPSAVGAASNSNSLTRRVPTAVPVQAAQSESAHATTRDAAQLRSRLSSFQSGTSRGRIAAEHTVDKVPGDTDEPTDAGTVITRSRATDGSGTSHQEEE